MRSGIDFSSWQGLFSTVIGLSVITLIMVGIRLLVMQTVQQRRQRENRQINERLRTLIAAYKTLGGSFTGDPTVDPFHLRDLKRRDERAEPEVPDATTIAPLTDAPPGSERRRRVRDAVEAALSDIVLLGTDDQVRLAARAADDLVAGRGVETAALVVSLRTFIREVLDLDPIPAGLEIPRQGPVRPSTGSGSRGGAGRAGTTDGAKRGGGGGGGGGGAGSGVLPGSAGGHDNDDPPRH